MARNALRHRLPNALFFGFVCAAFLALSAVQAHSQAITISTEPVMDRRYTQIQPTTVDLPKNQIDARGHQEILRILVAEQGFAMRPLPRGKKGLTLAANGKLSPSAQGYLAEITENGLSVKPGERVVLSNIRIDKDKIVFDINGGPEHKHEFLRHIQIGMGPDMTAPVVQQGDEQEPTGARITLSFSKFVPDVTPAQVKALLAPLISFDVKTPVQAYTDTLPPKLKDAILNHHVMVGMSTDMVLFAMGQPESKSREMDGQTPFEEWIYGHAPQDVQFVRINGNRVIRVEVAKLGQPLAIFTKDEVEGLMTTDGKPVLAEVAPRKEHTVELGDVARDPNTQAPLPPPTLRAPGEKLPNETGTAHDPSLDREGAMKPVVFPKDTTNDPANTVQAHPEKAPAAAQPAPSAPADKPADAADPAKPAQPTAKPDAPAAPPAAPATNFYSTPQPARS
jgi:hypothetical protein